MRRIYNEKGDFMEKITNLEAFEIIQKEYNHLFGKWIENNYTLYKVKDYFGTFGYETRGYSENFRMTIAQRINLRTEKVDVIGYSFKEVKFKKIYGEQFGDSLSARSCLELMKTYERIWDDVDISNGYHSDYAKYIQ